MLPFSCPHFLPEDLLAMKDCYDRGQIDAGPLVVQFECEIAHLMGIPERWVYCVGSGTAALEVASRLKPFQDVAASVLTWPGTYCFLDGPITPIDLGPELDGRPDYLRQGEEDLQIFVQLWGARPMPDGFPSQCRARHIVLDAAHNLFDPRHRELLEQGVTVCYSFGPLKQLTTGRGGAVISRHFEDLTLRLQAETYCHYGVYGTVQFRPGRNLQMTEPAAAIGLSQLNRWDDMQLHRERILKVYGKVLDERLITNDGTHSGHLAVVRIPSGSLRTVQGGMRELGVAVGHHYRTAEGLPLFQNAVCTLPCHLKMTIEQAEGIAKNFLEVVNDLDKIS
jgi:dTDP-4-amino-4,6-dideoxygalactose transaminase